MSAIDFQVLSPFSLIARVVFSAICWSLSCLGSRYCIFRYFLSEFSFWTLDYTRVAFFSPGRYSSALACYIISYIISYMVLWQMMLRFLFCPVTLRSTTCWDRPDGVTLLSLFLSTKCMRNATLITQRLKEVKLNTFLSQWRSFQIFNFTFTWKFFLNLQVPERTRKPSHWMEGATGPAAVRSKRRRGQKEAFNILEYFGTLRWDTRQFLKKP